ncbi:MAG: flagellar biosynthetic protein FliO [Lachnospiraceae bacterium]|nr:flagellar biosynthetic protein FliO [Lachnospiraceae bacterium]
MLILLTEFSTTASVLKLIVLLIVFILILAASYYFTKWYAQSGLIKKQSNNISIVETYQFSPGKYIYIAKIGDRYVAFIMSKDNVTKLMELNEEDLNFPEKDEKIQDVSFKEVFSKMTEKKHKNR